MTTKTKTEPTPLELAQGEEDVARAEADAWEQRKVGLETRGEAIDAELGQLAGQLRAGRADALRGDEPADLPALAARERDLKIERAEVDARLEIARAEQTRSHAAFVAAAEAKAGQQIVTQHEAMAADVIATDAELDRVLNELIDLITHRWELWQGGNALATAGSGVGLNLGASFGFDWRTIPAAHRPRPIELP